MVDHLLQMDIQRWHLRSGPVLLDSRLAETENQKYGNQLDSALLDSDQGVQLVREEESEIIKHSSTTVELATDINHFSAYAAMSVRVNAAGQEECWLWVVPQAKLPSDELNLLDKIVVATQSNWQSYGVADSYLTEQELGAELHKPLSAVIILGDIKNQWPQFFNHELYQHKRFSMGISLQDMLNDADKKRSVWQSLQAFL